jgi:hypothetical protein
VRFPPKNPKINVRKCGRGSCVCLYMCVQQSTRNYLCCVYMYVGKGLEATSVKIICREMGHLNFSYLQKVYQRKVYLAGFIYDLYLYSTFNKMISSPLSTYIAVKVNSDETLKSVRYIGIKRNIIIY